MTAPTIAEQTGWSRAHPHMLLQGFPEALDILSKITRYDFDLDDPAFRFYAEVRGVLFYAGAEGSAFWEWCRVIGENGSMDDPKLRPPAARREQLRIACGRLQDAAELYRTDLELTAEIMRKWTPPAGAAPWRRPLTDPAGDFIATPAGLVHADVAQDVAACEAAIAAAKQTASAVDVPSTAEQATTAAPAPAPKSPKRRKVPGWDVYASPAVQLDLFG